MNGFQPVADLSSSAIEKTDDAYYELGLGTPFPFYNKRYSSIFINEDGVLTFLDPVATVGPISIPIFDVDGSGKIDLPQERMVLIAPFWTEVKPDTGNVYYRDGLSSSTLQAAENIVKGCYIDQSRFTATAGVVVTWDQVSDDDDTTKKNSFQAILVYDDFRSFVIFYYSDMQYQSTSVPNVGFNAGDIKGGLAFTEGSYSALPSGTNCAEQSETHPGAYVFRVDVERMSSAGCPGDTQNIALQVAPSSGPMVGGNRITVMHGCDLNSKEPVCVFTKGGVILQTVTKVETIDSAVYCIPGPFYVTEDVTILVYKSLEQAEADPAENPFITAKYTVDHPDDSVPSVTRSSADSSSWNTAGTSLTITWDSTLFMGDTLVTVSVLQYDESVDGQIPTWELAYNLGVSEPNIGSFSFIPMALDNITETNPFGIIRVIGEGEYPVSLFSDVHMLGYLLHQPYQDNPTVWADEQCTRWDAQEDLDNNANGEPRYFSDVTACPCNLDQVELDFGSFFEQTGGCSRNFGDPSCTREMSSSRRCFLSTNSIAGAECCYSPEGNLIFSMDDRTGGSSDKAPMLGVAPYALPGHTPYLSHWVEDVVPYQFCCRWATDRCRTYLENRPGKDCYDYNAQQSAVVFGDPHFVTFDGRRYTFNGIGEYQLMEVASLGFRLHGRTTMATEQGRDPVASFLSAVAVHETGSDSIHIEVGQLRPLNLYVVGADGSFRQPDLWMDGAVYHPLHLRGVSLHVSPTFREITLSFHVSHINIKVKAETLTPSITVEVLSGTTVIGTSAVTGLMGDMDGDPLNDIKSITGTVYQGDDPTEMFELFQTWEATTPDILHRDGVTKRGDYRNTTFVPTLVTPGSETLPPSIGTGLESTCQNLQECIFDMSVTQTAEAGQAAFAANAEFVEMQQMLAKVETCRYIQGPEGGQVAFSDETKQYVVGTSVTFSCDDAANILIGPATRNCQSNRQWSNSVVPACIDTDCDRETLSADGVEVVKEGTDSDGNIQVTVGCPGTNVTSTLTCKSGEWTGGKISCSDGRFRTVGISLGLVFVVFTCFAVIACSVMIYKRKPKRWSPWSRQHTYSVVAQSDTRGIQMQASGTVVPTTAVVNLEPSIPDVVSQTTEDENDVGDVYLGPDVNPVVTGVEASKGDETNVDELAGNKPGYKDSQEGGSANTDKLAENKPIFGDPKDQEADATKVDKPAESKPGLEDPPEGGAANDDKIAKDKPSIKDPHDKEGGATNVDKLSGNKPGLEDPQEGGATNADKEAANKPSLQDPQDDDATNAVKKYASNKPDLKDPQEGACPTPPPKPTRRGQPEAQKKEMGKVKDAPEPAGQNQEDLNPALEPLEDFDKKPVVKEHFI
ncbi:sushi domain-containing protein 2-like isoform X2 [Asterias amurensis]